MEPQIPALTLSLVFLLMPRAPKTLRAWASGALARGGRGQGTHRGGVSGATGCSV